MTQYKYLKHRRICALLLLFSLLALVFCSALLCDHSCAGSGCELCAWSTLCIKLLGTAAALALLFMGSVGALSRNGAWCGRHIPLGSPVEDNVKLSE